MVQKEGVGSHSIVWCSRAKTHANMLCPKVFPFERSLFAINLTLFCSVRPYSKQKAFKNTSNTGSRLIPATWIYPWCNTARSRVDGNLTETTQTAIFALVERSPLKTLMPDDGSRMVTDALPVQFKDLWAISSVGRAHP